MNLEKLMNNNQFHVFFSLLLGIGIICILRPICHGPECSTVKAPAEKDFDQFVYRMKGDKCYQFQTEIAECPASGAIEAFEDDRHRTAEVAFAHRPSRIAARRDSA